MLGTILQCSAYAPNVLRDVIVTS